MVFSHHWEDSQRPLRACSVNIFNRVPGGCLNGIETVQGTVASSKWSPEQVCPLNNDQV
jgi:hypothetical protein